MIRLFSQLGALAVTLAAMIALNVLGLGLKPASALEQAPLPRSGMVRTLARGYEPLASDYYWLQAIQYFGEKDNRKTYFTRLPDYLDLVVQIDPRFCYPYVFAGNALPMKRTEDGKWVHTSRAIAILEQGVKTCADEWRVPFLLGYNLSTFTDRYKEAGDAIALASKQAKAPDYLPSLASRLYGQNGDLETALSFAVAKLAQTEVHNYLDEFAKTELEERIRQIQLELDLRNLRQALADYQARFNEPATSLDDLVSHQILEAIPADPYGARYDLKDHEPHTVHGDKLLRLRAHGGNFLTEPTVD